MAEKSILLALANERFAEELKSELGESWSVTIVPNIEAALGAAEQYAFGILVADLDLFPVEGREFPNLLQKTDLQTFRLLLTSKPEQAPLMKDVGGQHQFISAPCKVSTLKNIIERTAGPDISIGNEEIRKLVSQIRTFPTMPSLCVEIQSALNSPNVTTTQISTIIERDMAMTTKLLQVLNSAGFGLSRQISDLQEAVGLVGFEAVRLMVLSIQLMSEYEHAKPVYFSIERLWRRSTAVARMARSISLLHNNDARMAEAAFAAGLLHDLGKAVLASTFDEQYKAVQMVAMEQNRTLWETEKKNFGASHGEIGAYVLSLWGMPLDVFETAALHDHPVRSVNKAFGPLTAVHIAHAWEYELNPEADDSPLPKLDEVYLAEVGVLNQLASWRKALGLPPLAKPVKVASEPVIAPVTRRKSAIEPRAAIPETRGNHWQWIAAAALVISLLGWFAFGPVAKVSARIQSAVASVVKLKDNTNDAPVAVTPSEKLATTAPVASTHVVVTNTVTGDAAPIKKTPLTFPTLRLQGIFFSENPSAIINGRLIHRDATVDGVHVLEITTSNIVVEFQQQKKLLSL